MLELKQLKDLDELLDQIYEENRTNERFKALIKFAISKNDNNNPNFGASQIRNLETLAYSSTNLSDIKNYIKNQVGKDKGKNWSKIITDYNKCFGQLLLEEIELIEQKATQKHNITEFKLKANRGFIHQFVSEYLYKANPEVK